MLLPYLSAAQHWSGPLSFDPEMLAVNMHGDEDEAWLLLRDEMIGDRRVCCQWFETANVWTLSVPVGKEGVAYCSAADPRNFLEALNAEASTLRSAATDLQRVLALAEAGRQAVARRQLDEAAALLSDMDDILGEIE